MKVFTGKKAVVIGGSGGIGSEVSRELAKNGADLVIHGSHEKQELDRLIKDLKEEYGCNVRKYIYPFTDESFASFEESSLKQEAATADILCVCYGPFLQKDLDVMTLQEWRNISLLDYALSGFFVSNVLQYMKKKKWGRILLFGGTGTCSRTEYSTNAAYAGAKTAVGTLVQSAAFKYAKYGITCNAVLPGFTETEYQSRELLDVLGEKMPGGSVISRQSVAQAAMFLLQNPDLNGVLLRVDRGWSPAAKI